MHEHLANLDPNQTKIFLFPAALKVTPPESGVNSRRAEVFNGRTAKTSEVVMDAGVASKIIPGDVFTGDLVIKVKPNGSQEQSVTAKRRVFKF